MRRLLSRTFSSKPKILVSKHEIDYFLNVYTPNPHPVVVARCKDALDNPRLLKNLNLSNVGFSTSYALLFESHVITHNYA